MSNLIEITPEFITAIVATLSAAVAWFSYEYRRMKDEKESQEEKEKTLKAVKKELEVIGGWARGTYPNNPESVYASDPQRKDFYYPSRQIFKFDYRTIKNILYKSPIHLFSEEFVDSLIDLRWAVMNFYQQIDSLNKFAFSQPSLYRSVLSKLIRDDQKNKRQNFTPEEEDYKNIIFKFNVKIHRDRIGDKNSQSGLHVAWLEAQKQLKEELEKVGPLRKPLRFYVGDALAVTLLILGIMGLVYLLYSLVMEYIVVQILFSILAVFTLGWSASKISKHCLLKIKGGE